MPLSGGLNALAQVARMADVSGLVPRSAGNRPALMTSPLVAIARGGIG
jgi:hypothetical protein